MDVFNFAFINTADLQALDNAVILINRSRHHLIQYRRVIRTHPRRGWVALIIDSVTPDHYLMRNLTGRLKARAFELGINGVSLFYRLHQDGDTISAFESHLDLWITQQLRTVLHTQEIMRIDLAEPAGKIILQLYHDYQRLRSWSMPAPKISPAIEQYYRGDASALADLLEAGTELKYVQDIIKPGLAAKDALIRLINVLALPYFKGEPVIVEIEDRFKRPVDESLAALSTDQLSLELRGRRVVRNFEVLDPSTWPEGSFLPKGWQSLERERWE